VRAAAALALALSLALALAAGAAASAAGPAQAGLPGNKVVQPGVSYMFSKFRLQGSLPVEACSAICQVRLPRPARPGPGAAPGAAAGAVPGAGWLACSDPARPGRPATGGFAGPRPCLRARPQTAPAGGALASLRWTLAASRGRGAACCGRARLATSSLLSAWCRWSPSTRSAASRRRRGAFVSGRRARGMRAAVARAGPGRRALAGPGPETSGKLPPSAQAFANHCSLLPPAPLVGRRRPPRPPPLSRRPQVFTADQIDCASQVDPGVDYSSWNVKSIPTQTAGECATVCAAFSASRCVAFTWRRVFRSCELKFSLTGKFVRNENVVSAVAGPCTGGGAVRAVAAPAVPPGGGGGGGGGLLGGSGGLLGGDDGGDDDFGDGDDGGDDLGLDGLLGGQRAPVPVTLGVRQPAVPLQVLMPQATPGQPMTVVQQAPAQQQQQGQPPQQQRRQQPGPGPAAPSQAVPGVPLGTTTDFVTDGGGGGGGPAPPKPAPAKPPAGPAAAGPGGGAGGAGGGGGATTKIPVPGELQAECRKLSIDVALDHAVRDVGAFARDMREPVVEKFADALARRKEPVRAALKERLRRVAPGDKKGLQKAVLEAVAASVPEAAGGAVQLDGRPVSFAGVVWESLSTEPYVENCF
jgi:hypothetical protein